MSHKTEKASSHWLETNDSDSEEVYRSSDDDRETSRNAATSTRAPKRRRIAEDETSHNVSQSVETELKGFGAAKRLSNDSSDKLEQQDQSNVEGGRQGNNDEDDEEDMVEDDGDYDESTEDEEDEDLDDYEGPPIADKNAIFTNPDKLKPLSKTQLEASKKATEKTGVIYLSRIPVCIAHIHLQTNQT